MRLIGSCKGLRFRWAPNLLITYKLEKSLSQTAKGRPALRRREQQRAKPEIHRKGGLVSECEDGLRILKTW